MAKPDKTEDQLLGELEAQIEKGYAAFRPFQYGKELIGEIRGLAQFRKQLEKQVEENKATVEEWAKKAANAIAKAKNNQNDADDIIAKANEQAAIIQSDARDDAAKTRAAAVADASVIIEETKTAKGKLSAINSTIATKQAELDALNKDIETLRKKHL